MEVELIGADNVLHIFLCSRYFIEAQGLEVQEAVVYQEGLSSIILQNNGILSSGNRTKHIHIIHFLIKDRIVMGDIKVKYFLTGEISAGYFTKPLQWSTFHKSIAEIQGIP